MSPGPAKGRPRPQPPSAGTPIGPIFRYVLAFSKTGPMRFTGHLDLQRSLERTLRRADAPMAYTKGFHPRARLRFAAALPLGITSDAELCELWLTEEVDVAAFIERLRVAAAPGMAFASLEAVEEKGKSLPALTRSVDYRVALPDDVEVDALDSRIAALLEAETLPRERRRKAYDLRPLVESLARDEGVLTMRLTCRSGATGRPDEVLAALELDPNTAAHRVAIHLVE